MSSTTTHTRGTRLTLDLWHPNCWGIQATEATDAGLLIHRVNRAVEGHVKGHFTVYGDTTAAVEEFITAVRASRLTRSTVELAQRRADSHHGVHGNTSRELFVEYDPEHSIGDALVTHGFINDAPVRVEDGREHWPVFVDDDREGIHERLDALTAQTDADIAVSKIASSDEGVGGTIEARRQQLTSRQREVFDLACEMDYYAWPRETTTRELAAELGVSKTTMLEHLRKAEAKLLNPDC